MNNRRDSVLGWLVFLTVIALSIAAGSVVSENTTMFKISLAASGLMFAISLAVSSQWPNK